MAKEVYQDWVDYYRVKGLSGKSHKEISGYDHPLAQLTQRGLQDLIDKISRHLSLKASDKLLDVGCGAGLITKELTDKVAMTVGLDATREMILHAPRSIQGVEGLAHKLPFQAQTFDKVLCHSVFQYFPDHQYAQAVVEDFLRVMAPNGICLIQDLPDMAKRDPYFQVKVPDSHNLTRLFYEKSWFKELFPAAQVFDQEISDYENSKYRFNVLIRI